MNTLAYEPPPILLFVSKKINYLCLDKGTDGKHKNNVCCALTLPWIIGFKIKLDKNVNINKT